MPLSGGDELDPHEILNREPDEKARSFGSGLGFEVGASQSKASLPGLFSQMLGNLAVSHLGVGGRAGDSVRVARYPFKDVTISERGGQ